jgi:hypothetical protein
MSRSDQNQAGVRGDARSQAGVRGDVRSLKRDLQKPIEHELELGLRRTRQIPDRSRHSPLERSSRFRKSAVSIIGTNGRPRKHQTNPRACARPRAAEASTTRRTRESHTCPNPGRAMARPCCSMPF